MTYKEACEEIAQWFKVGTDGKVDLTGEDIFNLHPRGELFPVHEIYDHMKSGIGPKTLLVNDAFIAKLVLVKIKNKNEEVSTHPSSPDRP